MNGFIREIRYYTEAIDIALSIKRGRESVGIGSLAYYMPMDESVGFEVFESVSGLNF
jgi:hypothetical protein